MRSSHAAQNHAPSKHHARYKLSDGELDEDVCHDGLETKLCHVDNRPQPRVLVSNQLGIVDETKDTGIGQGIFIERLEAVYDTVKL